jgi:hypothetical protein
VFPPEITKEIGVYHLPTASGKQAYPGSADATILGAFLPLDRQAMALELDESIEPFEVYVGGAEDVRETDKLVIDSTNYFVRRIFSANFGGLPHKRLSISKQR